MQFFASPNTGASTAPSATKNADPFVIFALLFAIYIFTHHVYLIRTGDTGLSLIIVPVALLLAAWPGNLLIFMCAVVLHFVEAVLAQPIFSNVAIMSLFLAAGIIVAYLHAAWKARGAQVDTMLIYTAFAPLGRWLLIIMYVFGTLHKVNTDFLNPATSCAVSLWRRYPFPDIIVQSDTIHWLTMYGTLVLEASVIVMLLTRRLRWWGILIGVAFHGFLGLLPPGYVVSFSVMAVMLHSLFLPNDALDRFRTGAVGQALRPMLEKLAWRILFVLGALALFILLPWYLSWGLALALFLAFVVAYGREPAREARALRSRLVSPVLVVNLLSAGFFLNGYSPYLGFKTGQTIAMFSNLITEGGRSNHLLLPTIPLFDYQSRIVEDLETDHPVLAHWRRQRYTMVEYQVHDFLERSPKASATWQIDGKSYSHSPDAPLSELSELSPRWMRKLMLFRPVVVGRPRWCDSY